MVEEAKLLAIAAHGDQKYGSDLPYSWHLEHVAQLAQNLAYPKEVVAACWLHDVLEDTTVTIEQLSAAFPKVVVNAVGAVTFMKDEEGNKIDKAMSDPIGHVVKYCDAAVNFSASVIIGLYPGEAQWQGSVERYPGYLERLRKKLPTPHEIERYITAYK